MVNGIIIIILIVLLCFGIKSSIKHFKGEGSCCGGGSGAVKGKKPGKKKLDGPAVGHCTIRISGMHCQNCVNSVTKALNSIDGVAAKVSLRNKCAEVTVWTIMIMARRIPRNGKPRMRSRASRTLMGAAQKKMTRTA